MDPLAPLQTLLRTAIEVGLALPCGLVAARLMRRGRLHWSWAACLLALVVLARAAPALAAGALAAAVRGRRWQRRDLQSGGERAALARARVTPLAALRLLSRAIGPGIAWRGWTPRGELILGRDESGRSVAVPFGGGAHGGRHALVVGATGSGKTVTQTLMASRAIERGMAAVVVDPKGDLGMCDQLRQTAAAAGRRFLHWSPSGEAVYNPYARGSESEIADRVLAGESFTEPHYLRQAQRYLGHAVRALRAGGAEVSLARLVEQLDPDRLELLARTLPEPVAATTHAYLDSLTARQRQDLAGVRDRLAILAESDIGPWLDPDTAGAPRADLIEAIRSRAVLYFSLESDSRPLLSQMLGAGIVQDLQSAVAAMQGRPASAVVLIDEFAALAAGRVVGLFGRARSAGFSLLLGTQELSDLRIPGAERTLDQVMGNLTLLIAHRQVVPSSAELISAMAGGRDAQRGGGETARIRLRDPVLASERLSSLPTGWCAVIEPGSPAGPRITRVEARRRGS